MEKWAKKYADHVRTHGITQFLHIWDRLKDRSGDELLWGDEVCTFHHATQGTTDKACVGRVHGGLI